MLVNYFKVDFFFLIILLLNILGCSNQKDALGADNLIQVICNDDDRAHIQEFLSKVFSDTIYTPYPEPEYKMSFSNPSSYGKLKKQAYVVVASIDSGLGHSGKKLMNKILSKRDYNNMINNDPVIIAEDLYAKNQLFMIINASNTNQLKSVELSKLNELKSFYDELFFKRQKRFLLNKNNTSPIGEIIKNNYPWSIHTPWGWEIIKEDKDSNFVWIGREEPFQWISCYWEDGNQIMDELDVGEKVWSLPQANYGNIIFSDYKFKIKKILFNDQPGWEIRGLWESSDKLLALGGPFKMFVFYNNITNNTYYINTLIHNPGKSKSIYLRQLGMLAKTFRINR